MSASPQRTGTRIIPTMRYRDAMAAIDWLCTAFGFERRLVVPNESGGVTHAALTLDDMMIMVGSGQDSAYDKLVRLPADVGVASPNPPIWWWTTPTQSTPGPRAATPRS